MLSYYNEFDPFAAAWLRELIKAGHIAAGEVDERDIREVQPDDLKAFTQCHFFAGIGVWSYALRTAGWPDDTPVWTGSCPCQSFSASGKRGGFSDPRHLWPAWFRLIRECRPDTIFGEQVASKDGLAWLDVVSSDLEGAGYAVGAADLCAAGFGAPHIRQRLYFVAESTNSRWRARLRDHDARQPDYQRSGETGRMANAKLDGGRPDEPGRGPQGREIDGRDCEAGRMADTERTECAKYLTEKRQPRRPSATGELGQPSCNGQAEGRTEPSGVEGRLDAAEPSGDGQLGDAVLERRQQERGSASGHEEAHGRARRVGSESDGNHVAASPGETNGFWADAEWLWCRDGKYRPVEPGTFPLAHGAPNRVGRLRGYGNALCAEVAKGFIEAFMEAKQIGGRNGKT